MNTTSMNRTGRLEESLAVLLRYGSWLASAAIGLGFALALCDSRFSTRNLAILPNMRIAAIGIVLFILLPTLRVLLMLLVFIREGDFRLAATAGFVLAIILLGIFLGLRTASGLAAYRSQSQYSIIWTLSMLRLRKGYHASPFDAASSRGALRFGTEGVSHRIYGKAQGRADSPRHSEDCGGFVESGKRKNARVIQRLHAGGGAFLDASVVGAPSGQR